LNPLTLLSDDPLAVAAVGAIQAGDIDTLETLLSDNRGLATARIENRSPKCAGSRSLLHIATDWPGHFPNVARTIDTLAAAGADVNARFVGRHAETPLHWAASCNDLAALDALLDLGADLEAPGAVIAGGTPLADAVAFGQWDAARRLIARGAQANLWQAAALGLMDRVENCFARDPTPDPKEITKAFWLACHGGQRTAAEYLLQRGADVHWVGFDGLTAAGAAARSGATELADWVRSL
jgi:hypothetical protein